MREGRNRLVNGESKIFAWWKDDLILIRKTFLQLYSLPNALITGGESSFDKRTFVFFIFIVKIILCVVAKEKGRSIFYLSLRYVRLQKNLLQFLQFLVYSELRFSYVKG